MAVRDDRGGGNKRRREGGQVGRLRSTVHVLGVI